MCYHFQKIRTYYNWVLTCTSKKTLKQHSNFKMSSQDNERDHGSCAAVLEVGIGLSSVFWRLLSHDSHEGCHDERRRNNAEQDNSPLVACNHTSVGSLNEGVRN